MHYLFIQYLARQSRQDWLFEEWRNTSRAELQGLCGTMSTESTHTHWSPIRNSSKNALHIKIHVQEYENESLSRFNFIQEFVVWTWKGPYLFPIYFTDCQVSIDLEQLVTSRTSSKTKLSHDRHPFHAANFIRAKCQLLPRSSQYKFVLFALIKLIV